MGFEPTWVTPNGFQDFSCYGNITPDRGFCTTLSDADFPLVIGEIGVLWGAICNFPQAVERIVSNVFSNKILEKTLEDFDELWGVAIRELASECPYKRRTLCQLFDTSVSVLFCIAKQI